MKILEKCQKSVKPPQIGVVSSTSHSTKPESTSRLSGPLAKWESYQYLRISSIITVIFGNHISRYDVITAHGEKMKIEWNIIEPMCTEKIGKIFQNLESPNYSNFDWLFIPSRMSAMNVSFDAASTNSIWSTEKWSIKDKCLSANYQKCFTFVGQLHQVVKSIVNFSYFG